MEKKSNLFVVGLVALALVLGYTGYLHVKKVTATEDKAVAEAEVERVNKQILKYQSQDLLGSIRAKETLDAFDGNIIKWSQIINRIRRTIPTDSRGEALVEILSYSGSSGSKISLNMRTNPEAEEAYFDVADVIETFDDSAFFVDSFVPSVAGTEDEEGRQVINFLMTTTYVEDETLEDAVSGILDDALEMPEDSEPEITR